MVTSKLSWKPDEMLEGYLRWTNISSRSSNSPSRFMPLSETGIFSVSYEPLGSYDLTFHNHLAPLTMVKLH